MTSATKTPQVRLERSFVMTFCYQRLHIDDEPLFRGLMVLFGGAFEDAET